MLSNISNIWHQHCAHRGLRLDGGAAGVEASSSASRPRFRPPGVARPRFAADMLDRKGGELDNVSSDQSENSRRRYLIGTLRPC